MTWIQFRILFRTFLFRVVDLELISPQGDISKLLGQFASLLILIGLLFGISIAGAGDSSLPRQTMLIKAWPAEHLLIATTMLVVGLFAVLSWDATFPDRRDLLVLAPLPVPVMMLFLARVSAAAAALGITVLALNAPAGLLLPLALAPPSKGLLSMVLSPAPYRIFASYWLTVFGAGALIYGAMLILQGTAAQLLPRRQFLRLSAVMQIAAFCFLVSVYFLQPALARPEALGNPANRELLNWLPSYWFLGLFQELNGWHHSATAPLAANAFRGLGATAFGVVVIYTLSYFRTLRAIIEQPDIEAGSRKSYWMPSLGNPFRTAIIHFSVRTMLRSRRHRVLFAFYLGVGFAIIVLFLQTPLARKSMLAGDGRWNQISTPILTASIVLLCACLMGARVVSAMPFDLRANWIYRVIALPAAPVCISARRWSLWTLAGLPPWLGSAAFFLWFWPWPAAIGHLVVLGLLCFLLIELSLGGTQKLPFTCSYLPGKSSFHLTFWLCAAAILNATYGAAELERRALSYSGRYCAMAGVLILAACAARWRNYLLARSEGSEPQFEELPPPAVQALGLHRDGTLPMEPAGVNLTMRNTLPYGDRDH